MIATQFGRVPGWVGHCRRRPGIDLRVGRAPALDGVGERQLRRRFTRAMGYGPATYRRIARLGRITDLAARWPTRSLAELAADAGYHDEAHLARDARALAATTPSRLRPG